MIELLQGQILLLLLGKKLQQRDRTILGKDEILNLENLYFTISVQRTSVVQLEHWSNKVAEFKLWMLSSKQKNHMNVFGYWFVFVSWSIHLCCGDINTNVTLWCKCGWNEYMDLYSSCWIENEVKYDELWYSYMATQQSWKCSQIACLISYLLLTRYDHYCWGRNVHYYQDRYHLLWMADHCHFSCYGY